MTIEEALRTYLLADANISSLVSTRIYYQYLPQNPVYPLIRYQVISDESLYSNDGDIGLDRPRIQFDSDSDDSEQCIALAGLIRKRLSGFRGAISGKQVQGIFRDNVRDDDEVLADGITKIYRRLQDFFVWHVEEL